MPDNDQEKGGGQSVEFILLVNEDVKTAAILTPFDISVMPVCVTYETCSKHMYVEKEDGARFPVSFVFTEKIEAILLSLKQLSIIVGKVGNRKLLDIKGGYKVPFIII